MHTTLPPLQPVVEWHDVDAATFRDDVMTQYRPAILRGAVRHWPAVQLALQSPSAVAHYLGDMDNGANVDAIMTPSEAHGRIFYRDDMSGFNFIRSQLPVSAVLSQLARYINVEHPPSVAILGAAIDDCLPGFGVDHALALLDAAAPARIWIGNHALTPAYFEQAGKLACVVSGLHRYTLFPPGQIGNLYVGPPDFSPMPTPVSMVSFKQPDFQRHPNFRSALAHAQVAELEPGDALYIPALWWHHTESIGKLNILLNHQCGAAAAQTPLACLIACLAALKELPPEQRQAWATLIQHYLPLNGHDPAAHIPPHKHGVLARPDFS